MSAARRPRAGPAASGSGAGPPWRRRPGRSRRAAVPSLPPSGALLDEGLDVGEAEDRREAGAGHPPVRAPGAPSPAAGCPRDAGPAAASPPRTAATSGSASSGPAGRIRHVAGLLVGPGLGQVLVAGPMQDPLVAVAGEAGLHEQLDVAVLVGAGDVEPPRTALRGLAQDLVDEPEPDVAGLADADPVELDDRPLVADRVALDPDQARTAGPPPRRRTSGRAAGRRRAAGGTG